MNPEKHTYAETNLAEYMTDTIAKIQHLPKPLVKEVNDFIDFIFLKHDQNRWQQWHQFSETLNLSQSDFSDYLSNLETYEEALVRGDIQW